LNTRDLAFAVRAPKLPLLAAAERVADGTAVERGVGAMRAPLPADERRRLAALHSLELLDTAPDERFERICRIARDVFHVPMASIGLVDVEREWFKTHVGFDVDEVPRECSFGAHAILEDGATVIEDASSDLRFYDSPLVRFSPQIRFYAAYPVEAPGGSRLGVLAIADTVPRQMSDAERATLPDLAALVAREIGVVALASVDEPTGFLTWRGLSFLSRHELERASREGDTMGIVTVEVLDHDDIRRRFGGHAGDAALIEVADTLRTTLRGSDVPARLRGPVFAVLLPSTGREEADAVAERITRELAVRDRLGIRPYRLSFRIGVATLDPAVANFTLDELLARADSGS
jgi:diguanylate cyclase (GGDEF)-like protein